MAGSPAPRPQPVSSIHVVGQVLDSMDDGVLVVDARGGIVMCNPAASRVLGLENAPVIGAGFGETFLALDGLDAFSEAVLDAVQGEPDPERRIVNVEVEGETRTIALSTTWLRSGPDSDVRQSTVVAVFSDLTQLAALRETEARLARQVQAQLAELSDAYRTVEARNEALAVSARRSRVLRLAAGVALLGLVAAFGGWAWHAGVTPEDLLGAGQAAAPPPDARAPVTWTVAARRLQQSVSVVGRIAPGEVRRVLSPADGTIKAMHFHYGQEVAEGALLVELDVSQAVREYRNVRGRYLEARKRVEALEGWEEGREMDAARRALGRAEDAEARQRRRVEETAFLLERGVIAGAEHDNALERLERLREDLSVAERQVETVRAEGGVEARERAALEYRNVREELEDLESVIEAATVRAPSAGIVMVPSEGGGSGGGGGRSGDGRLLEGTKVSRGQALVQIAEVEALSILAHVDEVEIAQIGVGQPVNVTGDAFPGIELAGALVEVASHAPLSGGSGSARFAVRARIGVPSDEARRALRVGMSVDLHILVRDDPEVLTVPLDAVQRTGQGHAVRVRDRETGETRVARVALGATTTDAVEVLEGLEPGDEVLLPGR